MPNDFWIKVADLLTKVLAVAIGGAWALYKLGQHRAFKHRIQLDLDGRLFKLSSPENASLVDHDESGRKVILQAQPCTHAVELLLRFRNKGATRFRVFNIRIGLRTMRAAGEAKLRDDGRLSLKHVLMSGNVVPENIESYYLEPGIEQTVSYVCLIPAPRELLHAFAEFSLDQERVFPEGSVGKKGVYPQRTTCTFPVSGG